jgi:hypothetical protein
VNPHAERLHRIEKSHISSRYQSDTTEQIFFDSRMIPTPPDQSDHMHPSFNPKVPGSRPGRPLRTKHLAVSYPKQLRVMLYTTPVDG